MKLINYYIQVLCVIKYLIPIVLLKHVQPEAKRKKTCKNIAKLVF